MKSKKKPEESEDFSPADSLSDDNATAIETHRIVRTYQKRVPLDDVDDADPSEFEEGEDVVEVVTDPIADMLASMGISEGGHTWMMIIERLPEFEKNARYDLLAKRVHCGTRPFTENFIEDIQREFARPGKSNNFRLTIRRDNKIFKNWPGPICLEPPPAEVIAAEEAKQNAAMPSPVAAVAPNPQANLKQSIAALRELMELRDLFAPVVQPIQPQVVAQPSASAQPLTTETALLHLIASDESVIDKVTGKLSSLINRAENGAREVGFLDLLMSAIQNDTLPKMIRAAKDLWQEVQNGQSPAMPPAMPNYQNPQNAWPVNEPAPSQAARMQPAPTQGQTIINSQPVTPPPEISLLQFAVSSCAQQMPTPAAAAWIVDFESANPGVTPYISAFLTMPPGDALQWFAASVPQAAAIASAPHAPAWIESLQNELKRLTEEGDTSADT